MIKQKIIANTSYYAAGADGIKSKQTFTKQLTSECVKMYFNSQHVVGVLSPITHSFLMFMTENMDPFSNEIATNQTTVRKYHEFRKKTSMTECSDAAVIKALQKLRKACVLITTPESGNNIVNPKYFYRGSELDRKACINRLLSHSLQKKWANTNLKDAIGLTVNY
jgi:hypothetical protein